MNTSDQINVEAGKLSLYSRIARIAVGSLLLAIPMTYSGVLDALAVLPLVAIYPILTGALGYGLVELLVANRRRIERPSHLVKTARASLLVLGIGLIGIVMVSATAPAWLALLGIFPILMGTLDSDLFGEAIVTRRALQQGASPVTTTSVKTHALKTPTRSTETQEYYPKQAA